MNCIESSPKPETKPQKKNDWIKRHHCTEPYCDAVFARPYRLKRHKLLYHSEEPLFSCDHCEETFNNPKELKKHELETHIKTPKDKEKVSETRTYHCKFPGCEKTYKNKAHLSRHKRATHDGKKQEPAICGVEDCGKVFFNKYNLQRHIQKNHTGLPFKCQECNEQFRRKSHLHMHLMESHGREAPYKCTECPQAFVQYHLYQKHIKRHKTYQCDCEKTFKKWSEMLEHRKKECTVPKKGHKCTICDKTFALRSHLREHALVHVSDSKLELFECQYLDCGNSYKYKKNLNAHVKSVHEKIFEYCKCPKENCSVVLKSRKNLKQHLRLVHDGLKSKERKPRKTRKDKGKPKKSMAEVASGVKVSIKENSETIEEESPEISENQCSVDVASSEGLYLQTTEQIPEEEVQPSGNISIEGGDVIVFDFPEILQAVHHEDVPKLSVCQA